MKSSLKCSCTSLIYFILFILLAFLLTCHCSIEKGENTCGYLKLWLQSASVSLHINNKGFHRETVTIVKLSPDVVSGARVLLVYRWPSGVYVDPYQLAFLREQRDWQILLDSAIDLEVPAHKTSGFLTYVYPAVGERISRQLKLTIPVHGRYHQPSFIGKTFAPVEIEPPELLLRTDKCTQLDIIEPLTAVDAPCTADNSSMCQWVKLQHQQGLGHLTLQFPVGDGSLLTPVCCVTLLVTMICCASLSRLIWKHRIV